MMGYYDVFYWLINRRASGDDDYFTPAEIGRSLRQQGIVDNHVAGYCVQMQRDGYAESRINGDLKNWLREYRANSKSIKERYG